jgi:uncharacterized SAM-binding protein YcdF (DUF218 family)
MDFGFIIKKTVTFFVEPMGFVLTLSALGLYFLYVKKDVFAKLFLSGSFIFLFLFSFSPFSNWLVKNIEDRYEKYSYDNKITYIHVLGGGHTTDKLQPLSSRLTDASLKRVLEGVLIYKNTPNAKIIFTGYGGKTDTPTALMNAKLAYSLGVKLEDMIINSAPKDTQEEALFSKVIIGENKFALVTSATHMHRAMMLFKKQGMNPIAAPTDFKRTNTQDYVPGVTSFRNSKIAIHEYLGILWSKIRD